jgi:hypothetical protein
LDEITVEAQFYHSPTAEQILAALPLEGSAQVWGQEIYFSIPLQIEMEADAREEVEPGELGYWPAGPAFCIFFGPTPVSRGDEPRAYSPVNVFGKIEGGLAGLRTVPQGAPVRVFRREEAAG